MRQGLESGSSDTTVYALEILELVLSDELKPHVFPIVEGLTYPQALRRLESVFPRHRMAAAERLSQIVNRDYDKVGSWTRACALAAAGDLAGGVVPDLVASLYHPDPLMSELAAFTLQKLDPAAYARHHEKLDYDARERIAYAVGPDGTQGALGQPVGLRPHGAPARDARVRLAALGGARAPRPRVGGARPERPAAGAVPARAPRVVLRERRRRPGARGGGAAAGGAAAEPDRVRPGCRLRSR